MSFVSGAGGGGCAAVAVVAAAVSVAMYGGDRFISHAPCPALSHRRQSLRNWSRSMHACSHLCRVC